MPSSPHAANWATSSSVSAGATRVRGDRDTARGMHRGDRFGRRDLHALHVAAPAVEDELRRERRLHVGHDPRLHHRTGHVRAPDVLRSAGDLDHAIEVDRVAVLVELLHHPPRPGKAPVAQRVEQVAESARRRATHRTPACRPGVRRRRAWKSRTAVISSTPSESATSCRLGHSAERVVVGQCDRGKAERVRAPYHLRRRIGAIGGGGMQLQVGVRVGVVESCISSPISSPSCTRRPGCAPARGE